MYDNDGIEIICNPLIPSRLSHVVSEFGFRKSLTCTVFSLEWETCFFVNYDSTGQVNCHLSSTVYIQWHLPWETTAMRDHLSWKTTHSRQNDLNFSIAEPECHQRPPVLRDHIFVANWVVFQDRFYCSIYELLYWQYRAWYTWLPNTIFQVGRGPSATSSDAAYSGLHCPG